ncbi:vomeronasal type-1 receptor 4-like [Erethizon dorsatum]
MPSSIVKGTISAFLTGLGTMGNIFVFVNYMLVFAGDEKKSIHLILIHLTVTNTITLLSKGMPSTLAAFGVRNFLGDVGCKIVCYLERVARGLSICTSGLLTVVQAITISPRHSAWRRLKPRSAWYILLLLLFLGGLNTLIAMNLLHSITNISMNSSKVSNSDSYCYLLPESKKVKWIFLTSMVLRDAGFLGIMGGSSGYMVHVLHKHHQQVLHLQNSKFLYTTPPEIKAAQSVLFLMLCFLLFYWIDCLLSLFISSSLVTHSTVINAREFLTVAYAILSPFVLIHREEHLGHGWGRGVGPLPSPSAKHSSLKKLHYQLSPLVRNECARVEEGIWEQHRETRLQEVMHWVWSGNQREACNCGWRVLNETPRGLRALCGWGVVSAGGSRVDGSV